MVLENLVNTIGKGKLPDYISNPKGSRQFQQFIKLGTKEHRNSAVDALCKQVPDLAMRNIYALLTLEKIVTYGLKSDESFTSEKFLKPVMTDRKIVEQLMFHRLGCKFLNKLYLHPSIKPALKKQMLQIVLVPRAIEVLGDSKGKLRQHYLETAKKCVDKELLGFEIIQRLLKQAVCDFPIKDDQPFNEELLGMAADGLPHLLSSRDGVVAAIKLLGVANAKQKKNIIKELKGKFAEMAKNSVTNVVILRLLDCVDDTVLVGKSVLSELVGGADYSVGLDLIQDAAGRIPFLYAMEGLEMKSGRLYFQQDRLLLSESEVKTALKEKSVRQSEILSKILPSIIKIVKSNMTTLIQDENAKDVVVAAIRASESEQEKSELVALAMESLRSIDMGSITQPTVTAVNSLIKDLDGSKLCWSHVVSSLKDVNDLVKICSGLGSFVLMNVVKSNNAQVVESVKSSLHAVRTELDEIEAPNKGLEIIKGEIAAFKSTMTWDETVAAFKVAASTSAKRTVEPSEGTTTAKKLKTVNEEGQENLFEDDEEDDELWGIVGDDDEFADE